MLLVNNYGNADVDDKTWKWKNWNFKIKGAIIYKYCNEKEKNSSRYLSHM